MPGAIAPASRNGQSSDASVPLLALETSPIAAVSTSAVLTVTSAPSTGSSVRRNPNRTATASAPKSAAEQHARSTAANYAGRRISTNSQSPPFV